MKLENESKRWYEQGIRDADSAARIKKEGIYEVACFLCQQSAEKLLKAFLYYRGESPVVGHSTFFLAKRCAEYEREFGKIIRECKRLDKLYISTRYPNALVEGTPQEVFDEDDANQAIADLEKVKRLVSNFIAFKK